MPADKLNPFLRNLQAGGEVSLLTSSINNEYVYAILAAAGPTGVLVDLQHSDLTYDRLPRAIQIIAQFGATPVVRVSDNTFAEIGRVLDAGAMNVICPMVSTPEQCATFVSACLYPGEGVRSWGPTGATTLHGVDSATYFKQANRSVMPIAMIETPEGVENAHEIAAVKGLGGIYIGSSDLSIGMGLSCIPSLDEPVFHAAVKRIVDACVANNVPVGAYMPAKGAAQKMRELGARILWAGSDHMLLKEGVFSAMAAFKENAGR